MTNLGPIGGLQPAVLVEPAQATPPTGAQRFATMLDGASAALDRADIASTLLAAGKGDVAQAALLRAKADVALEIAAIAASRAGAAVSTLLQTQV
jgi:hypothetical protein